MGGVFINYRGEDSQTCAALLDRELSQRFGKDQVFLDSRSIPVGEDFVEVLLGRLRTCNVLLVIIGPHWLTLTDQAGQRLIDSPTDWIHREIREGLAHGLRVIPVLTDGVRLPTEAELPADIAELSRRQYVHVRRRYVEYDLTHLVDKIIQTDPELAEAARQHQPGPVPRQLLGAPRLFTGRAREFAQLTGVMDEQGDAGATVVISAIGGAGGIGKTWLALHWAHQNVQRFPDGQLYVNLRGFDPLGSPMSPGVAVRGFLDAFGLEPSAIPVELDAQTALYRSLVAGRQMLIVLDNARDTAQVAPLLPGDPSCMVVVTSRHQLAGLVTAHGARLLDLDVLTEVEARELLTRHLGHGRVAAEPEAVTELLKRCAGLPLALGIVAARAVTHPGFPLSVLAEELREVSTCLDALDAGELNVNLRAVLSWSYQALDAEAAGVFGLLGLAPGPDISLPAAASLTAQPISHARKLLRDLETAHLVQEHAPGRYRLHDLIRLYAAEQVTQDTPQETRQAALRRVVDFYLHTAHAGERLLYPHRQSIELGQPTTDCVSYPFESEAAVLTWFITEHPCLLATQQLAGEQSWHTPVWQLAWSLNGFHLRQGNFPDNLTTWCAGFAAAERLSDPTVHALAHRFLGHACAGAGRYAEAMDHLQQALVLAEQTGDVLNQAHTHQALARAWEQQGDHQLALTHATQTLRLYQTLGNPVWEAMILNSLGWLHARLGHHQQARAYCERSLTMHRQQHDRDGEARTLDSLGYIARCTGQLTHALSYYRQAFNIFHDLGHAYDEADTAARLGETHHALGHYGEARDLWQQALALYQEQYRNSDVDRIQQQLAALDEHLK